MSRMEDCHLREHASSAAIAKARTKAVVETIRRIRIVKQEMGISRTGLKHIQAHLAALATRDALFPPEDFPAPQSGEKRSSCLYRLSEDADYRFALYLNAALGIVDTPPHNHTTWAVISGIRGAELNRFYQRANNGGVQQTGEFLVTPGTGVAFLPDDLHSIHIRGEQVVLNFHLYGIALEQLTNREYYSAKDQTWHFFPAHSDIREARPGRSSA